jgi:conjugal transfer mating pair stabilization protein TraN
MEHSFIKRLLTAIILHIFLVVQLSTVARSTWAVTTALGAALSTASLYAYADAFDDAAGEGQDSAASLLREFGLNKNSGQMSFKKPDGSLSTESLTTFFPSSGGVDDTTTLTGSEGDGAGIGSATDSINTRLDTENSAQAEAYRTIKQTVAASSHPNRKTDPVFDTAKAILDSDDPAYDMVLKGCTPVTTNLAPHVPSYQTCNIYESSSTTCEVTHEIQSNIVTALGPDVETGSCGPNCISVKIGSTVSNGYSAQPFGTCQLFKASASLRVEQPDAISTVVLAKTNTDGNSRLVIDGVEVWTDNGGMIADNSYLTIPANDPSCGSSGSLQTLNTNITANVKKTGTVGIELQTALNDVGFGQVEIHIYYNPSAVVSDSWSPQTCIDKANSTPSNFCTITTTCLTPPDSGGCIEIENGQTICPADPEYIALGASPISSISKACRLVQVAESCGFAQGMATGWVDASGASRTIGDGLPTISTCGPYETNQHCAISQSDCILGSTDTNGRCYGREIIYDCGYTSSAVSTSCTTDTNGNPIFDTTFTGCTTTTETQEVTTTNHITDIKTCESIVQPVNRSCTATRDLDVRAAQGIVQVGVIGYSNNTFRVDLKDGSWALIAPSDAIASTANVSTVDMAEVCGPGAPTFEISSIGVWYGVSAVLGNDWDGGNWPHILQSPSCENGMIGIVQLSDVNGTGDWDLYSGEFRFNYKRVVKDEWTYESEECEQTATQILDSFCPDGVVSCTLHNQNCVVKNGVSVCAPDIQASEFAGIGDACMSLEIANDRCQFNSGNLACWTDTQGVEHCPENLASFTDTCEVYDTDPSCVYFGEECISGAAGDSGTCYAFTRLYDCGHDVPITNIIQTTSTTCDGAIRCMGGDCITQNTESNPDFGKAAAAMASADFIAMETSCADQGNVTTCEMFTGDAYECKKALGGYVDCCDTPAGVSLQDYMELAGSTYDVAEKTGAIDYLSTSYQNVVGAWTSQVANDPTSIYSQAISPFNSAYESIVGSAVGETVTQLFSSAGGSADLVSQGIESFGPSALQRYAAQATGDFLANNFGLDVATSLLETGVGAPLEGQTAVYTGNLASSGAGALLGAIMFAYMIYSIAVILIQIVWSCEAEEFELGSKRELKSCHFVGSYCKTEALGSCIEKRDAYCCFSSPFARIVQEQGRMQLGGDWGTPEAPQCGGFSVSTVEQLDWDAMDLSEWVAILHETGQIPSANDALTQFQMNATTGALTGIDSSQEIQELIDLTDQEGTHDNVREELWGR